MLSGDQDGVIRMLNTDTGEVVREFAFPERKPGAACWAHVCLTPDGRRVIGGARQHPAHVHFWDAATGAVVRIVNTGLRAITALEISEDGKTLFVGGVGKMNVTQARELARPEKVVAEYCGRHSPVTLAVSPDDRFLAAGHTYGVDLWCLPTGNQRELTDHAGQIYDLTFSPDGKRLLSVSLDQTAKLWDPTTGELVLTLTGHSDRVQGAAFTPDGRRMLTCGGDLKVIIREADPWE